MPISASMYPSPKETYVDDFVENLNTEFSVASDVWDIYEETTRGLGICDKVVSARINHLVDSVIGSNLGDDYKKLLFNGVKYISMGDLFYFDTNYWVVINTETIKSISSTCSVRRCNNVLRWLASDGSIYQYPCVIDYKIVGAKDLNSRSQSLPLIQGSIVVTTQHNAITSTIQPNQRFLFGNVNSWVAYRVSGGGIGNYQNLQTVTNTSYGKLELLMEASFENDQNDDVTNGIANVDKNVYTIIVTPSSYVGAVAGTIQLTPVITLNGEVVTRDVTWASGTLAKATVNTSGLVTLVAVGTSTIRCALENNSTVYDDVIITVSASPTDNYAITISPTTNYILLYGEETYTISLYKNGADQSATFTFGVDGTSEAPESCYEFNALAGGKTFKVQSLAMSLGAPLIISAVSVTAPCTITGMAYTSKVVTLTAANSFKVGDLIKVAGVNSGYSVTNIDGTWTCGTGTNATTVVFTVTNQPVGTTPQVTSHGTISHIKLFTILLKGAW